MPDGRLNAERGAAECGVDLRDQLFEGVLLRSERSGEIAIEPVGSAAGMTEFVQRRTVPVDRLEIGLRRRHLHVVVRRHIEGAISADAEIDAGGFDQGLYARFYQTRRHLRRSRRDILGQVLALIRVENGEALQERDRLGFLAGFASVPLLVLRHEAISIDDGGAAFALTDISAERQRLAEGQPALAGKAALNDGAPEQQHVDSGIGSAGRGVLRKAERRLRRRRAPWLDPRHAAGLQLGDDLVGDLGIEIGPVAPGAGVSLVSGHRGSPRRAPRAFLSTSNPSRQTGPHSHSRGVAGCPRRRGRARLRARPQGKAFPSQHLMGGTRFPFAVGT